MLTAGKAKKLAMEAKFSAVMATTLYKWVKNAIRDAAKQGETFVEVDLSWCESWEIDDMLILLREHDFEVVHNDVDGVLWIYWDGKKVEKS
jgi:hypothetical protein